MVPPVRPVKSPRAPATLKPGTKASNVEISALSGRLISTANRLFDVVVFEKIPFDLLIKLIAVPFRSIRPLLKAISELSTERTPQTFIGVFGGCAILVSFAPMHKPASAGTSKEKLTEPFYLQ